MKRYVLAYTVRYESDTESGAMLLDSIESALKLANRMKDGINPHDTTLRLFELGREIPLVQDTIEEPQPAKTSVRFRVQEEE